MCLLPRQEEDRACADVRAEGSRPRLQPHPVPLGPGRAGRVRCEQVPAEEHRMADGAVQAAGTSPRRGAPRGGLGRRAWFQPSLHLRAWSADGLWCQRLGCHMNRGKHPAFSRTLGEPRGQHGVGASSHRPCPVPLRSRRLWTAEASARTAGRKRAGAPCKGTGKLETASRSQMDTQ